MNKLSERQLTEFECLRFEYIERLDELRSEYEIKFLDILKGAENGETSRHDN